MKVLDGKQSPYVPSWKHPPGYLQRRMAVYRKKVEDERKAAENQQQQRPEEWK
jgi:hypothetical protein